MNENNYSALIAFPEHKLNEFEIKLKLQCPGLKTFNFAVLKLIPQEINLNSIEDFDYLILASSFAAEMLVQKIESFDTKLNLPLILSIGPSISKVLNSHGLEVYQQSNKIFNIAGLAAEIKKSVLIKNKKFLFLGQSKSNYTDLKELIIKENGKFEQLIIYKSCPSDNPSWENLNDFITSLNYKLLIFSSPEGVKAFHKLINSQDKDLASEIKHNIKKVFCLGSLTQKEACQYWPHPICLCPESDYSYESLIELIQKNLN